MKIFPLVPARLVGFGLLALAVVAAAGCGILSPKKGGGDPPKPFEYPALTTPESTLANVGYAWERRDSSRTKQIYDDQYLGTSTDLTDVTPTTLTYYKYQEVGVVSAMQRRSEISRVTMDLKRPTWIRLHYNSDPAGWTAIQITGVNIQVDDTQYGTQLANSSTTFEFKFKPTVDHTSPTDTTWQVVGWTETRQ
ncbi:MAG: hypothetical protein ACM3PF_08885 [Bacteroidota bacterium]